MADKHKKYNIKHRKIRTQYTVYEDLISWVKRNFNPEEFRSESEFVSHLISLGIQQYTESKIEDDNGN